MWMPFLFSLMGNDEEELLSTSGKVIPLSCQEGIGETFREPGRTHSAVRGSVRICRDMPLHAGSGGNTLPRDAAGFKVRGRNRCEESRVGPASDQSFPQGVFKDFKRFSAEMEGAAKHLLFPFFPFFSRKFRKESGGEVRAFRRN